MQIEGADAADGHSLGAEYYTTLRSEVDNEVTAATAASEEAEAEIKRWASALANELHHDLNWEVCLHNAGTVSDQCW